MLRNLQIVIFNASSFKLEFSYLMGSSWWPNVVPARLLYGKPVNKVIGTIQTHINHF